MNAVSSARAALLALGLLALPTPSSAQSFTVTMFDLMTLAPIRRIPTHTGGLDGIMYDEFSDRIILTNHSRPIGTATAIDAASGDIVGVAELEDDTPEGAMTVLASWSISPCEGPTGIAYDRATNRIFSGSSPVSVRAA